MKKKNLGLVKILAPNIIEEEPGEDDTHYNLRMVNDINHKIHEIYGWDSENLEYRRAMDAEYDKLEGHYSLFKLVEAPYQMFTISLQGATKIAALLDEKQMTGVCTDLKRQIRRLLVRRATFFTGSLLENTEKYDQFFAVSDKELTVINKLLAKEFLTLTILIGEERTKRIQDVWLNLCKLDNLANLEFSIVDAYPTMDWIFGCGGLMFQLSTVEEFTTKFSRPEFFTIFSWFCEWTGDEFRKYDPNTFTSISQYALDEELTLLVEGPVKKFLPGLYPVLHRIVVLVEWTKGFVFSMEDRLPHIFKSCYFNIYERQKNPIINEFELAIKKVKKEYSDDPGLMAAKISDLYLYAVKIFSFFPSMKRRQADEIVLREIIPFFLKEINKPQNQEIVNDILNEDDNNEGDSNEGDDNEVDDSNEVNDSENSNGNDVNEDSNKVSDSNEVNEKVPVSEVSQEHIETYEELVQQLQGKQKPSQPEKKPKVQPITLELKVRKLVSLLKSMGFKPARHNGTSHQIWKKGDKFTMIPIHGDSVKSNIARSIYETLGL